VLRLWAPRVERVTVEVDGAAHDAEPTAPGWWAATVSATHGSRYGFRLDGGPLRPDPASRAQPDGVHALSQLIDPARVAPRTTGWHPPTLQRAVVYELHVGTFTAQGTLDAAAIHLPRLAELGVTHVELMPVNAFDAEFGWGYDGVLWFATHPAYGGPHAVGRFVEAAHDAGLAVVLDVVHNHLGPSGNYLPEFGPYLADRPAGHWGEWLNLDGPGSDAVRALLADNVAWWLGALGVDGLRLDAVHALVDTSARHILSELRDAADDAAVRRGYAATLIAESDRNDPGVLAARSAGGHGMDAMWADELHHALHVALTDEAHAYYADFRGLADVAAAYRRGFVYGGERFSPSRGRTVGAPLGGLPGWRLVGCLQNHDQIGNRAQGERITILADADRVRAAIALVVAAPHTPMLFMGDEHGETRPFRYFVGFADPAVAAAVRRGRREELAGHPGFDDATAIPDPIDLATARASTIDWDAADTPAGLARRELWRALLALRRGEPALHAGRRDLVEVVVADASRLVVRRGADGARDVVVTANLADQPARLPAPPGAWRLRLSTAETRFGGDGAPAEAHSGVELCLPPRCAALWSSPSRPARRW
jgi:maltooligosyltrehalose trehalohydrolase